jgi:hypothetical protein
MLLDPKNLFLSGCLNIVSVYFSGGNSSQERGFGGVLKIPVFSYFHKIFHRNSYGTGIPVFA